MTVGHALQSLRLRLVLGLALASCLLWGGVGLWRTLSLGDELNAMLDERLVASARMVAAIVHQFDPGDVDVAAREAKLQNLIARDGVACEVSVVRSEVGILPIARTGGTPEYASQGAAGFGQITKGGKAWRVYVMEEDGLRVATADRLDQRAELVRSAWLALIWPFALGLAVIVLLTWWITTRTLKPLAQLQSELEQRAPRDNTPVAAGAQVQELAPVVHSLNQLLARMEAAIAHERRWSADAAHELRTPLTAIKTHVQVAQLALAAGSPATGQALAQASLGITQLQQTMEQLLQLARVESAHANASASTQGQSITQALQQARQQSLERARAEGWPGTAIEVQSTPADAAAWAQVRIALPPALLTSALSNLLDNALRHQQGSAPIEARLALQADGRLSIAIRDHGPGLTPEECQIATQRFWRKNASGNGSGLGLTLVQRIAESAGGQLTLAPAAPGLRATLEFPLGN
ncbi:MAG: sensor histidine kinase N-terminal domain-containing protein [Proteobacteria bacterium]|nr:sensor histidine kinase N-terminal domain-containing protein [Pseudomonadota bacterium]MBS0492522.1 sensor histidine kinase N-terminal domain-containing protein [Pseudomonadota bacterium]